MKQAFAGAALIASAAAIRTPDGVPVYVQSFHFNEDPHSVPNPLAGKPYMTSTQAKYLSKETWDTDTEVTDIHPRFHTQFNRKAKEPKTSRLWLNRYWPGSVHDGPVDSSNVMWQVSPDLGEMDDHSTLLRESDKGYLVGKSKFHGWTNPLGWTDDGKDDDLVLLQMTPDGLVERRITDSMLLQYEEAEGPTKVDFGEIDNLVISREADKGYLEGKSKFHGWTNPLGWTDDGKGDEKVI